MTPQILLYGRGNMAKAMEAFCQERGVECKLMQGGPVSINSRTAVAVHFGSGGYIQHITSFCDNWGLPLIQGATRGVTLPELATIPIVKAPNLSLPMARLMTALPGFLKAMSPGMEFRGVETHQKTKADKSGTARGIADALGVSHDTITMVRDVGTQLTLGVPAEHLDGHAYHRFILSGLGVTLEVSTKIHGRRTYAEGALVVAQALIDRKNTGQGFPPGFYTVEDILCPPVALLPPSPVA